jgi:hypothetical protein
MHRFRNWLVVLLLLGLFVAGFGIAFRDRLQAGKGMPEYSSYSREDNGLGVAAGLLSDLGFQPLATTRPPQVFRQRGVLFVVEPRQMTLFGQFPGLSEADSKSLLDWVNEGNTLVLCMGTMSPLHTALGVTIQPGAQKHVAWPTADVGGYTEPTGAAPMLPRVDNVVLERESTVRAANGVPLWWVGERPGAMLVPHGRGRVLVLPDPSLFTHRSLKQKDNGNVLLLYNIARMDGVGGRVYFDEYHHGIRSGGGYWDYLRARDLHWIGLQLLAMAGLCLWAAGVRLGPALRMPRPPRADAVDYASAVARIYQRAGLKAQMAAHLSRDFFASLTRLLHLQRTAEPAEIIKTWKQRRGDESARELAYLVNGAEGLRTSAAPERQPSRRELLHWARSFDEFLKRLSSSPSR